MSVAGALPLKYDELLETALTRISDLLKGDYSISKRTIGLLLLQGDQQIEQEVREREASGYDSIKEVISQVTSEYSQPLSYIIALRRHQEVKRILTTVVTSKEKTIRVFSEKLSRAMMNPLTGVPILLVVLYFGLYQFVGVLGAGTLVDLIEGTVFGQWINP